MKNTKLARIYGRFSSKPQERGDSKRRQIEGAKAYAERNGITIKAEYFDEAVSGKAGLNLEKEFGRLLKDAQPGEIVLCEQLDRIGRQNPFILGKLIYDLVQKGLSIVAWQEDKAIGPDNIDTLATQFQVFTGAAVGHAENVRKMTRLRETITKALKNAETTGVLPRTLIKYLPECFDWNVTKGCIEPNEPKAAVIRRIFNMFNNGTGKTTICQMLNKEGVPTIYRKHVNDTTTKKSWLETSIKQILKNESYAGVLHCKGHVIKCLPPVVTKATFDKTQLLLQRFSKRAGKTSGRVNNLFNGIAVCKHCGGTIGVAVSPIRPNKGATTTSYGYRYRCKNARTHLCDHHYMLNADMVEYLFFMVFFMGQPEGAVGINTAELREKIEAAESKIKRLADAITNLYDMAEEGDSEAKDRIAMRKQEKADVEQELTRLKGQTVEANSVPELVSKIHYELLDGARVYDASQLKAKLANNETRIELRNSLPVLFEKVVFDTTARTVEGVLKPGILTGTFLKDITVIHIPRLPHSKPNATT